MTTAIRTYHPGLGSVENILSVNAVKVGTEHSVEPELTKALFKTPSLGGYRTTLAYRSSVGDQIQKFMSLIPSLAKDLYNPHQQHLGGYIEAKNTVDALKSVARINDIPKVILYLADNSDVCNLALELATASHNRQDVDNVIVEMEQDPESDEHSLFVTAVVSTEDFNAWDAIDEHILGTILEPSAAINRARVVFSIAHAESV
ncbi:hypothetical protein [uncultured Marinobacter sp.]|mgnify:CR=1 FL=1|uniref:hypothetical protein n=1 Tax=uncultured Marinobacter sp. TaxID=187379 RepID=UPI0030DAE8E8|tara:strand:- start:955 stop:1563 length:609 start_codon:yes stop_codon:yes gene_type:complete